MATTDEYRRNIEPFALWLDGTQRVVRRGELLTTDDPAYVGREHLFETVEEHAVRADEQKRAAMPVERVERVTAAPGEVRDVVIPTPAPESQGEPAMPPIDPAPQPRPSPEQVPDPSPEPTPPAEPRGLQAAEDEWLCPEPGCGFTSATSRGLNIHQRVHNPG